MHYRRGTGAYGFQGYHQGQRMSTCGSSSKLRPSYYPFPSMKELKGYDSILKNAICRSRYRGLQFRVAR